MYTEEEAKTKWCPCIRFTGAGTATDFEFMTNRNKKYADHSFHCIASECMAWRWVIKEQGYCGLAGKP